MPTEYQGNTNTYETGNICGFHLFSIDENGDVDETICGLNISDQETFCGSHAQGTCQTSIASQGLAIPQTHTSQQQYNTSQAQDQQSSQYSQPQQSYGGPNTVGTYTPGRRLLFGQPGTTYNQRNIRNCTCARCGLPGVSAVLCSENGCHLMCQDLAAEFCHSLGDSFTQQGYALTGQCLAPRDGPGEFCQEHSTGPVFNSTYRSIYYPGRERGFLFGEWPQVELAHFYGRPEFLRLLNGIITREQWIGARGEANLFPNMGQ